MKTLSIIAIAAALSVSAPAVVLAQESAPPQGDVVRNEPAPPSTDETRTEDEAPPSRDETAPPTRDETPPIDDSASEPPADQGGGDNGGGDSNEQEQQHRDNSLKDEMSCTVYPSWKVDDDGTVHDFLDFENTGNTTLPKGTRIKFLLPDGSYYEWELDGPIVPGGTWGLTDILPAQWPADWECSATVKLPPANP